ncbi:MAG: helix-turn-helix domain-containing protein [Pseudomonadota bacterium]
MSESSVLLPEGQVTADVPTVARLLGVGETTVRGWVRRGYLASVRIGGRRLVLVADLHHALQGGVGSGDGDRS